MSMPKQFGERCQPPIRLVLRVGSAVVVMGLAAGIFLAGMLVGYRQACSDFGIYESSVDQKLLDQMARLRAAQSAPTGDSNTLP